MAPQLVFVRPKNTNSLLRIADEILGQIVLTGPDSMIDNLEIQHFTLAPAVPRPSYKFTQTPDGAWQQQSTTEQPAPVQITKLNQKIHIRFHWQPPPPHDQSVFNEALRSGVNVTLTYLLDGQEARLVSGGVPVIRPEREKISPPYSRK